MGQPASQQTTITHFPIGEADVIVYHWDYSGGSTIQLEQEDSIVILAEESRAEAASTGQTVQVVSISEQYAATILGRNRLAEILQSVGWESNVIPAAIRVIECESHGNPTAIGDSGRSVGLFQLNKATWFRYAGTDPDMWADPYVNAATALATYNYDIARGSPAWTQWSCKP